ncbi:MATE family efflux transporter [Marinobacterium nitratireducens]|uniref:Multidrug-efflux transporter n=1 Tax=Marinobacterium nitratireducens TaxID=518897 RepID=A0A917Z726_9GAMM|nr:MATE family efflux transporter [Marinobacterium nitratireducens]GGO75835.1 MATE family efflux transporter [Marinobacterium nitratireducens]
MNATCARRLEARALIRLGAPIVVAQLSQTAMGFVDTLMAGRVSARDLAAVSLGNGIWLPIFLALSGLLMATTPMVAHHIGANRPREAGRVLQQGFWISLAAGLVAFFAVRHCHWLLIMLEVSPPLAELTQSYLRGISWGLPAILVYQLIRSFCEGFGHTRAIMRIGLFGLACNVPLNYIFIHGKLGLPALGGAGCGWATAVVMLIMLAWGLVYLCRNAELQESLPFRDWRGPRAESSLRFLRLGLPIGFALLIEVSMFTLIALLLARLGDITVASHQITMSFTGLTFMLPLSVALAITIRVGRHCGAGDPAAARLAASTGLLLALACAACSSLTILIFATPIAQLYSDNPEVVGLAAQLLVIAAFFQFSDAIQVCAAGALRGYKDTAVPLALVFVAYWAIGLPVGYVLGLTDLLVPAQGAAGFWYGLIGGLTLGALLLGLRLLATIRRSFSSIPAGEASVPL